MAGKTVNIELFLIFEYYNTTWTPQIPAAPRPPGLGLSKYLHLYSNFKFSVVLKFFSIKLKVIWLESIFEEDSKSVFGSKIGSKMKKL